MAAFASATAPALPRIELVNKTQLDWLPTKVKTYSDKAWCPQVAGALHRCIEAYDDDQGGYTVEYHQKTDGGRAMGRLWASCGMQSLYKPFRGVIANLMGLVDWDMRNAHPEFLLQLCGRHGVPSKLLKDYVADRDA